MESGALYAGERVGLFHYRVSAEGWQHMLQHNARRMALLAFWADEAYAMALFLAEEEQPLLISTAIDQGHYLAASEYFPAAQWGERMARDLWGVEAWSAFDDSPALDDGCWSLTAPLSSHPLPATEGGGQPLPQCRIAPSRSPIPGLLGIDYTLEDGRMEQVEVQIAAGHRGVLSHLKGLTPQEALFFIGRISASGFVAHPLAFIRAVEQAESCSIAPQERDRRLILLEVERLGLHLYDIGRVAQLSRVGLLASLCDHARESLAETCHSHGLGRRLTDTVQIGSGAVSGVEAIVPFVQDVLTLLRPRIAQIKQVARLFDARLKHIAPIATESAWDYALGGVIGRASGRYLDMRYMDEGARSHAMGGAGRHEGDAWARQRQRLAELEESLRILEQIMADFGQDNPPQTIPRTDEGLGVAEGARGDVWYRVTLKDGRLESVHIRDSVTPLLALLGPLLEGASVDKLPLILASLGVSPAGAAL